MAKTPNTPDTTSDDDPGTTSSARSTPARTGRPTTQRDAAPQPTEQLPLESEPVSATSSASGGATGLGAAPFADEPTKPSVFRRHPLATGVTAGVIAVVLVSGLTAWGVGRAVTASLTSSTASEMPMGTPTTAPTAAPAAGGRTGAGKTGAASGRVAFRATIQTLGTDSWTILTKQGKTVTVTVDASTRFGTKKASATATSFAVGDSVVVVATRGTDGTPTASRIAELPSGAEAGAAGNDATTGS